jgi:hypothetical protein
LNSSYHQDVSLALNKSSNITGNSSGDVFLAGIKKLNKTVNSSSPGNASLAGNNSSNTTRNSSLAGDVFLAGNNSLNTTSYSSTSGNVKLSILGAGTATLAGILWQSYGMDAAVDTLTAISGITEIVATQVVANLSTASTATVTTFMVKGTFQVTAAGTLIPSVAQTTGAATMVTTAGSYFMLNRIGSTTVTNVGQWT